MDREGKREGSDILTPSESQIIPSDADRVCNDFRRRCTPGTSERIVGENSSSRRWRRRITERTEPARVARGREVREGVVATVSRRDDCRAAPTLPESGRLYHPLPAPALYHPLDVARWRRRVGGVSVRTVLDVEQSAYVRNNVSAD